MIINLVFLLAFVYIAYLCIEMLKGIPAQGKQILYILVGLFAISYFLSIFGFVNLGLPMYRVQ